MRLALISDAFPPLRSSGAVQLRDLSRELVRQGHEVTVMVASPELEQAYRIDQQDSGVRIVRLRSPKTKDVNYALRTLNEYRMPYAMLRNLKKTELADVRWDGVIWYSPTIFLGPLVDALKRASNCPSYLILRDIFPEWAVDMGLMGRGLPYRFFKKIANYQYSVADVIGVQTAGNLAYFKDTPAAASARVEVLHNWLADAANVGCSIEVGKTPLAGRKIFVYAGNMGIAQGMGILLDVAIQLRQRADIGFLFVGRGSDAKRLRDDAAAFGLDNVLFFDEIDPDEIPGLYAQCHAGLVALDPRHKSHNIPGKFLSYMQSGLPVLASINAGNDLVGMIQAHRVGAVCTSHSPDLLAALAIELMDGVNRDADIKHRCRTLAKDMFSAQAAAANVTASLELAYESTSAFGGTAGRVEQQGAGVAADETAPQYPS